MSCTILAGCSERCKFAVRIVAREAVLSCRKLCGKRHRKFGTRKPRRERINYSRVAVTAEQNFFNTFLQVVEVVSIAGAIGLSSLPLFSGDAKRKNKGRLDKEFNDEEVEDNLMWGVMGVVSFLPLVNWTVRDFLFFEMHTHSYLGRGCRICDSRTKLLGFFCRHGLSQQFRRRARMGSH
jgi:hypothetical protein